MVEPCLGAGGRHDGWAVRRTTLWPWLPGNHTVDLFDVAGTEAGPGSGVAADGGLDHLRQRPARDHSRTRRAGARRRRHRTNSAVGSPAAAENADYLLGEEQSCLLLLDELSLLDGAVEQGWRSARSRTTVRARSA